MTFENEFEDETPDHSIEAMAKKATELLVSMLTTDRSNQTPLQFHQKVPAVQHDIGAEWPDWRTEWHTTSRLEDTMREMAMVVNACDPQTQFVENKLLQFPGFVEVIHNIGGVSLRTILSHRAMQDCDHIRFSIIVQQ